MKIKTPSGSAYTESAPEAPVGPATLSVPAQVNEGLPHKMSLLWRKVDWGKIVLFGVSLFLFILAIVLMKEGAASLTPLIRGRLALTNPWNSLGFGWLFAYLVMSGSPVAASALTFFDAGAISQLNAFTMITGSRFGASLVVLLIGFVYILRGRDRANSLSMGLLSLFVTGSTYLVALFLGAILLQSGVLNSFQLSSGGILNSILNFIFEPIVLLLKGWMPEWILFPIGLIIILFSFSLFDKCLPQMSLKESRVGQVSRLVYRPVVMFLLGATVTLVSMSVSLSLSLLVPLSERGFVRRENVIPYIMGANITTFIDTLFASILLNNPDAFAIVLAQMVSITIVSLAVMIIILRPFERAMLRWEAWATANNYNLAIFLFVALALPIVLVIL